MIVSVDLELAISKHIKVRAWKGVIAAKAVYDSFKAIGVEPDFPFKVRAPEKLKPELKPGSKLSFSVSFWGERAEEGASALINGLPALEWAVPVKVSLNELEVGEPPRDGGDEPVAVMMVVDHGPTYYRFHGAWVPLPSAKRFVLSAFKRASEALGEDLKEEAEKLSNKLEAIGGRPKFAKYRIHFGEEVPAFSGKVKYYGVVEEREACLLSWLTKYLPYLGVGSSPGLGFGDVKEAKLEEPPFDTPVRKWAPEA